MADLAQELIDKIVEYVSTNDDEHEPYCSGTWWRDTDRRNLKASALVSPAFLTSSQRCLFRSFMVRLNSGAIRGFAQKPHLAAYVRDLRINATHGINPMLVLILPLFGGVTRLVIDPGQDSPFRTYFQTVFPPLLRLPNLRCLGLFNCSQVPTSFIHSALSSFREVALINVDLRDDNSLAAYSDTFRPHTTPNRLIIDCSAKHDTVPGALIRCKDSLPDIEHLELFVQKQESLGGRELTHLYSNSLTTLVIHFLDGHNCDPIALPNLPRVRFLTLRTSDSTYTQSAKDCVGPGKLSLGMSSDSYALWATITDLPTRMPNIEKLTVVLGALIEQSFCSYLHGKVDEALKQLPHLREMHIRGSVRPHDKDENDYGLLFDAYLWDRAGNLLLFLQRGVQMPVLQEKVPAHTITTGFKNWDVVAG
ncbi:hypothetical protein B0H19DRAFT_1236901 [Mycena capillaripes]|nr:hypothetical protein B0H19DRAFT_1236901 [Mycena capillaripes]